MLNTATIPGRHHRLTQQNCHDFALAGRAGDGCYFGLAADGCGSKHREADQVFRTHNEVGAKLLSQFAGNWLKRELSKTHRPTELIAALYDACLAQLAQLITLMALADESSQRTFTATHLLSTLLGFVITPEDACFFWLGDGFLCHNGSVRALESDNRPDYLAYRLLPNSPEGVLLADGFHMRSLSRPDLRWLAVATDGWSADQLSILDPPPAGFSLQRWMNVQSRRRDLFEDDAAIAAYMHL